ncbi:15234_t:CDS:1 [Dentiscutata erythropus]|uniref:15234_t:CDS:1 n=1 Tax=Dentiscutata erythropus TaxID=1348616 RepID=A0A9N9F5T7_9GLOM|nr:15234_t:CDS:1 [Dentiscutata erythropus]
MTQKKTRNHTTTACTNCRKDHVKCTILSGEDKCIQCNKRNLPCNFITGKKRGPKPRSAQPSDQDTTSSSNSFSASDSNDSFTHSYSHTTTTNINIHETTENAQISLNFHEQITQNNEQNITYSFSNSDLNDSFSSEIPHLYIYNYDSSTEASQNHTYARTYLAQLTIISDS